MSEVPPDGTLERFLYSVDSFVNLGSEDFSCLTSEAEAAAQEIYNMSTAVMKLASVLCDGPQTPKEGEADFDMWLRLIQEYIVKMDYERILLKEKHSG